MVFVGTCNGIVLPGIRAERVGIEIPVTSFGKMLSAVSLLFSFGFKLTEVDCVWSWKSVLVFWLDSGSINFAVIVVGYERISSKVWLTGLFALIARVIILDKKTNWEKISVLAWCKV